MQNKAITSSCILSKFYIKPQLRRRNLFPRQRCILSKFYIKPQRRGWLTLWIWVVSYRNSTSNHNFEGRDSNSVKVVSYRNSTSNHNHIGVLSIHRRLYLIEILHQTTTWRSTRPRVNSCILSKFYIKPQLSGWRRSTFWRCILSKFYIKPQPPIT